MCSCHCRQSLSDTLTVDAPQASATAVWQALTNVEDYPYYMSQVSSVFWPHGHGVPMKQGYSWRETRLFYGKCHVLHKTVTKLSEPIVNDEEADAEAATNYSVSISVAMDVDTRPSYRQVVNTCTITVIPYREQVLAKGSNSVTRLGTPGCRLVASWGWLPAGLYNRLEVLLCGRWIRRLATESFEIELEDMVARATSKQRQEQMATAATPTASSGSNNSLISQTTATAEEEEVDRKSPASERVHDTATAAS